MATRTNNLKLSKAEVSDAVKSTLTANNNNFDKLDDVITRLKANQISGTASGTEIEIAESANMESVLKVHGNSEQTTRSGKNKLQDTKKVNVESNGVTFIYNANGTYTVNGTNNGNYNSALYLNSSLTLPAGTYYIIPFGVSTYSLTLYDGQNYIDLKDSAPSFTITKETTFVQVYFQIPKGTSGISNFIFYPMLATEPIAKEDYEPYGVMPSPEFESPIMSVKSKSDNLFDSDYSLVTKAEFVKQSDGSYYRATPKIYDSIWENTEGYTGRMSFTGECKWMNDVSGRGMVFMVHYTDGTKKDFMTNSGVWNKKWGKFELVTEEGKVVQKISTSWGGGRETYFKNIMLNKGTIALPYQAYGYVPAEARVEGKNLFNQDLVETTGITEKLETGFKITNTSGTGRYGQAYQIPLKAGTYRFVGNVETDVENDGDVSFMVKRTAGNITYHNSNAMFGGGLTTFGTDVVSIQPYFQGTVASGKYWQVTDFMILREDETDLSYEKGGIDIIDMPLGDIELRSTPDGTRDTFVRVDGVWNKAENITPFTIAENMVLSVNIDRYNVPYANVPKTYISSGVAYAKSIALLTAYDEIISTAEVGHGKFATNFSAEHVAIFNSGIADLATAKTILAGETGIIKRAEPTYTPITDPALISALDELEQLILHKGYNRITVTGVNGVKAYLDLNYYKDINIVLDNINTKLGGV